ncbi:DNA-binding GntR family transcriptional regulator [Actinocrispum wychmicini]|uniref:DNA-binding GntR family transcriptional regulator n=1 Tax=Actinocrispum wychmicini TaxID=1213861 RepID=A0A4R2JCW9_9PSEU|nr:DNA-binding GntR family transcriptional regulator [Actinocrispum wychmicini]
MFDILRAAIISLELAPGRALSENELATRYGVSRTPIRSALIRLADEGLVEIVPQLGTFVARIDVREVREAQFVREALERASLRHAVRRATEADHLGLQRLLAEQREAAAVGDLRRWFRLDEDLHRTLLEVAGHPRTWAVVQSVKVHMDRVRMLSLPEPAVLDDLLSQHVAIVDAVVRGRPAEADTVMAKHLRRVLDHLDGFAVRFPDYFAEEDDSPIRRHRASRRVSG